MEAFVCLMVVGGFFYFMFSVSKMVVVEVIEDYDLKDKFNSKFNNKK